MNNGSHDAVSRTKLSNDLRNVIDDFDGLLKTTLGLSGEKSDAIRAKLTAGIGQVKAKLSAVESSARASALATDDYVKEHPWKAIGAGALAGAVIGILIGRR